MSQTISKWAAAAVALLVAALLPSCGRHCDSCTNIYNASGTDSASAASVDNTPPIFSPPPPYIVTPPFPKQAVEETKPLVAVPPKPPEAKTVVPDEQPKRNKKLEQKIAEQKAAEQKAAEQKAAELKKPIDAKAVTTERKAIRIRAGSVSEWKDKAGNVWLPDAGFIEGAMVDRGRGAIERTGDPELYSTERCCMEKFIWPVPDGKYKVSLHFAETFEDVKKAGERVFSVDVSGQKLKDFDIFKEAGGANKALVKTFHVTVTGGKLEIVFVKSEQKEPAINGIEIIPE